MTWTTDDSYNVNIGEKYTSQAASQIKESEAITVDQVKDRLPEKLPISADLFLTGSVAEVGWSANDVDFYTNSSEYTDELRDYLSEYLRFPVQVGDHKAEGYKFVKIYDKGSVQRENL